MQAVGPIAITGAVAVTTLLIATAPLHDALASDVSHDNQSRVVIAQTSMGAPDPLPQMAPTTPAPAPQTPSTSPRMDYIPPIYSPAQPAPEDGLATGSRGEGRQEMRGIRTRRLPGRELLRAGVRGAGVVQRALSAAALEPVLYCGRLNLSGSPKRRDGALQFRRAIAGPLRVPHCSLRRRKVG